MPEETNDVDTVPVLIPLELITPDNVIEDPVLVPPEIIIDIVEDPVDPEVLTEDPLEVLLSMPEEPLETNDVIVVPVFVSAELAKVAVFNPPANVEDAVSVTPELVAEDPDGPERVPEDPPELVLEMPEETNKVDDVPVLVPLELVTPVNVIEDPMLVPPEIIIDVVEDPVDPEGVTVGPPETEFVPLLEPKELNNVSVVPVFVPAELVEVAVFNPIVNVEDAVSVPPELIMEVAVNPDGPERVPEDPEVELVKTEETDNADTVPVLVSLELITPVNVIEDPVLVPPEIIIDVVGDPVDPEVLIEDPLELLLVMPEEL